MPQFLITALLLICAGALIVLASRDTPVTMQEPAQIETGVRLSTEPLLPLPTRIEAGPRELLQLGERLFHDPILSRDGTHSCASCHPLDRGGTDGTARSAGTDGQLGEVNTPTVLNVAFNFVQFWDGRARTLAEQLDGPVTSERELASSWPEIVARLSAQVEYREAFAEAGFTRIDKASISEALVAYERSLITPNSRFDRYLLGEPGILNAIEMEGYQRFKRHGCASCHQGVNVGGNLFHRIGVMRDYFADRGNVTRADWGRFNATGKEDDRFVFKVPSLRNVAETGPYFHDAHAKTLDDAIALMGRYQLGRQLSEEDRSYISAFLKTLTGEWPQAPQENP